MGAKNCLLLFLLICSTLGFSSDKDWTEVKSPHFTVLGDGPDEQPRSVALSFEQARAIFTDALPGMRLDSEVPTVIFATRDVASMRALFGQPLRSKWAGSTFGPEGLYIKGEEDDYAIVEMDVRHTQIVATHEYIHKLLHLNFRRLPRWLDEGLAEFFATSNSDGQRVILGIKSERLSYLSVPGDFYPVDDIIKGRRLNTQVFYAESWALVHYMVLGPDMNGGAKLNNFLTLLQKGTDQEKAFQQVFGDENAFTAEFFKYIKQKSLPAAAVTASIDVSKMPLSVRKLPVAEGRVYLASLDLRRHDLESARKRLTAALQDQPKNWLGHEQMGFLDFSEGNDEEAVREWNTTLAQNPMAYLALYYKGLVDYRARRDAASAAQFMKVLDDVLAVEPNFALAYLMRSRMLVQMGDINGAAASASKAMNLDSDHAGYILNLAEIQLLQRKYTAALSNAHFVARFWDDANRGEALDLISRIRAASKLQAVGEEKKEEDDLVQGFATGTIPIRGEIVSVSCSNNRLDSVNVSSGGKEYAFRLKEGSFNFSRTIGITGEYFNVCYHAKGYPIVVRARGTPVLGSVSEMGGFEIRNFPLPGEVE
jgi:tetratricopeptide (TPR) repeat protein